MAGLRHPWRCSARYSDGSTVGLKGNGRSTGLRDLSSSMSYRSSPSRGRWSSRSTVARDLREPLGGRRLPRRGDREEDEVTLTGSDARGDLHLAKVAGFDGPTTPSCRRQCGALAPSVTLLTTHGLPGWCRRCADSGTEWPGAHPAR